MSGMPYRVMFFSYKGGAGRSVACANVAHHLVESHRSSTAIFDFDIESVGQSYIHRVPEALLRGRGDPRLNWIYLQDLFNGSRKDPSGAVETLPIQDFEKFVPRTLLDITRAGKFEGYRADGSSAEPAKLLLMARPVSELSVPDGRQQQSQSLRSILMRLPSVEFVLFDSPSGTQPLAGLARNVSQAMVVFCRPSRQFLEGTRYFLQRLVDSTLESDPLLEVLVVLSAVPMGDEFRKQRNEALQRIQETVGQAQIEGRTRGRLNIRIPELSNNDAKKKLLIPEVPRLKWQDEVLTATGDGDASVNAGVAAYRRLAEILRRSRERSANP